ncbi:MAG: 2-isopropylmalate synthase, partial [Planctomycetaceae bacterium]|nr:2-isopropylmalate synthase [Planctomycetaceae bacterium]
MDEKNRVRFFDTTLRDGEQSPGINLNASEKLEIAEQLARLRVDIIEAGFPIASPGDFDAVRQIAERYNDRAVICALARCRPEDIDRAWEALQHAANVRIHVFLATSSIHRQYKLKMDKSQIIQTAVESVKRAVDKFSGHDRPNVEFSPEDAAR